MNVFDSLERQYDDLEERMLETGLLSGSSSQAHLAFRADREKRIPLLSFDDLVTRVRQSIDNPTNALKMYGEDTTLKIIPFGLELSHLCEVIDAVTRQMKDRLHPTWEPSILLETAMPCTGISLVGTYQHPSDIHYRLSARSDAATKESILRAHPERAILYALSDGTVEIPRDHFGTGEGGRVTGTYADGSERRVWTSGRSPEQCMELMMESGEIGGIPESVITDLILQMRYENGAVPCVIERRANEEAGRLDYQPDMTAGGLASHMMMVEDMEPSRAGCVELLSNATDASGQWTGMINWTRQMSRFVLNETATHVENDTGEYDRTIGVRPMVLV